MFKYLSSYIYSENENKEEEKDYNFEEDVVNVEYENLENETKILGQMNITYQEYFPQESNILNSEDLKSSQEHSDEFYVITEKTYKGQTCKTSDIIKNIYNTINKNCFLHGAFVFEDEKGLLLNALTHNCGVNRWRKSLRDEITHNTFMNEDKFRKLGRNSILDTEFLTSMKLYYPRANIWKYYQYENFIKNEGGNTETLKYLCNPKCNQDEKLEECTDDRKAPKKVMLFYPFRVKSLEKNVSKRYLYLKLESSPAISVEHAIEAAEAYTTDVKDNSGYPRRRERLKKKETSYDDKLRIADNEFYDSLNLSSNDKEDIRFYNDFVRSHNELFIPQSITNRIIKE